MRVRITLLLEDGTPYGDSISGWAPRPPIVGRTFIVLEDGGTQMSTGIVTEDMDPAGIGIIKVEGGFSYRVDVVSPPKKVQA